MGRSAATADGAAPTMEHAAFQAMTFADGDDLLLGSIQAPCRSHDPAILAGVGVAQHNLLSLS